MTVKTLNIDVTLPADDIQPDKSETRAKWSEIKSKYETLAGQALRYRGAWSSGAYLSGDVVTHINGFWRASADITTEIPGTDAEWVAIGWANAAAMPYDNTTSGLTADDLQASIDELKTITDLLDEAIGDAGLGTVTSNRTFTYPTATANVITLSASNLATDAASTTVSDRVTGIINDPVSASVRIDLPVTASAGDAYLLYHDDTQTGAVTVQNVGGVGTINGAATLVSNQPGTFILLICKNNPGSAPVWRTGDVRELVQVLIRGYVESVVEITATDTSALTYTYTSQSANIVEYTLEASPASFTISGVPSTRVFALSVKIIMDGVGGHTWPHPTGCKFVDGVAPTITDTAAAETWLTYVVTPNGTYCFDGGTAWST